MAIESEDTNDALGRDEIKQYIDARNVSASEAYARIMGWPTHKVRFLFSLAWRCRFNN